MTKFLNRLLLRASSRYCANAGQHLMEDTGLLDQIPENLRYYIDTEAIARDLIQGGDTAEIKIQGKSHIVQTC